MPSSIFSSYSAGENQVTSSLLAVLRSLSINRIERLLGALTESEFVLVHFENQVAKDGVGVPDGLISSSIRLLIETKIKRNAVNSDQLVRHLNRLKSAKESYQALLVLTPDDHCPPSIKAARDKRVIWNSFVVLTQAIDALLEDTREVISEREAFLLRELQEMLMEKKLIGSASEVLVVPAKNAWPDYKLYNAYVCQPNRTFKLVERVAFYCSGQIQRHVPQILKKWESVRFDYGTETGWLGELIKKQLAESRRESGLSYKVLQLSGPDDSRTIKLEAPIYNNLESEGGRPVAFTMGQRYVSMEKLKKAKFTSELVNH